MTKSHVILSLIVFSSSLCFPVSSAAEDKTARAKPVSVSERDWPWWRGPNRDGIASADQKPPLQWSASKNILWKAPVPGRGHGSPTVVDEQVLLATADEQREIQSVLCFDRQSGKVVWSTEIHRGGLEKKSNKKASQASSTIACDGERLYINFLNKDAVHTTALSRDGKRLWKTKISDYVTHQGYGSSPAVYGPLVIVSADNKSGGAICGLSRTTGDVVWRVERPKLPNYSSPAILNVAGREQLLFPGCDLVASFEPLTGKKLWAVKGATTECVTTIVTDGDLVFTSGGYPKNHVSAVRADGSGELVWENSVRVYVPSLLILDDYLYAVTDAGVAVCWKSDTGEEAWKGRLAGTFSASPVLVGEHIFATNEGGETFVFKAKPSAFELVEKNSLGDEVFATPTICKSRIYMRVAERQDGERKEALYCIAER